MQNKRIYNYMESNDTKLLTLTTGSATLMPQDNLNKRKETKNEIETFLARVKYAIEYGRCQITLKFDRRSEESKKIEFTNRYTINELFPNENPVETMKRELTKLSVKNYIETVKDLDFPELSELRVFGTKYSADVFIKFRVVLANKLAAGNNTIFVLSFHFAEYPFDDKSFPYKE